MAQQQGKEKPERVSEKKKKQRMKINIITLFPDFFKSPLETGVLGRALQTGLISICLQTPETLLKTNIRVWMRVPSAVGTAW